jgi:hypothetical protein
METMKKITSNDVTKIVLFTFVVWVGVGIINLILGSKIHNWGWSLFVFLGLLIISVVVHFSIAPKEKGGEFAKLLKNINNLLNASSS